MTDLRAAGDAVTASVLLVDDYAPNLLALEAVLAPLGHRLVRATSGKDALAILAQEDFAAILLDVQMPIMDGFETAALIKQQDKNQTTPIIFITAVYGSDAHAFTGYSRGAVDYLTKPFDPDMLRAKVAVFVELYVERERLKREAEALRVRERFMGVLGHDLRSPLSSIAISAATLTRRGDLPEPSHKAAQRIGRLAERMARMVQDLLDFSQSRDGGGIATSPRPMDLGAVVRRVVSEEILVMHQDRSVTVSVAGDTRGAWDEDRVEQVVTNLVVNALVHGADGGPVQVTVRGEGPLVELEVHNDGAPIPPDLMPALFNPFRRGKTLRAGKPTKGLGLGLYIVEQIAHAHGGTVRVASTAERGTTFTVAWPRTPRPP